MVRTLMVRLAPAPLSSSPEKGSWATFLAAGADFCSDVARAGSASSSWLAACVRSGASRQNKPTKAGRRHCHLLLCSCFVLHSTSLLSGDVCFCGRLIYYMCASQCHAGGCCAARQFSSPYSRLLCGNPQALKCMQQCDMLICPQGCLQCGAMLPDG